MATCSFKVGDQVQVGPQGEKGKIIEIYRPLGTYPMYKVHLMTTGTVTTAAVHELVKGMPDHDFQDLFDCFSNDAFAEEPPLIARPLHLGPMPTSTVGSSSLEIDQGAEVVDQSNSIPAPQKSRFAPLPVHPLEFVRDSKNKNTNYKTEGHIKVVRQFLDENSERRPIHEIPPIELNELLMKFLLSVRKVDGGEYEPTSLRGYISSLDR
jgi:hypothetical protein